MEKLGVVVAFLLLASLFQPLIAQDLELDVSQLVPCPGKFTWPELLGVPAKWAREIIQKENPNVTNIPSVLNGSPVSRDFRCDRVRLFVNVLDVVVVTPRIT
ncbi:hypothetical protein HAX54_009958 [Datura stramonium]|uniref:Uncharacterized protein n=1 Tax=Datura stramonium TaxID=4076 RepID=A0ABS8TGX3_DATST|nr:hypothetical protein [Datura stramonium]